MTSASHLRPAPATPRHSAHTALAGLGDSMWLSYYHLIDNWRRPQRDGFIARPVHTIDLAALDEHRITLSAVPSDHSPSALRRITTDSGTRDHVEVQVLRSRVK